MKGSGEGDLRGKRTEMMDPHPVFKLLGGPRAYRRFVLDGVGQGHREDYYIVEDQRFLGAKEFVKKVQEEVEGKEGGVPKRSLTIVVEKVAAERI